MQTIKKGFNFNNFIKRKIDQDNIGWLDEIRKLNDNFSKLETNVQIAKNINNLLSQRVVGLERQCWANAQYSGRECLEISAFLALWMTSPWKKRLFKFSKKLVAKLILATLKRVILSPKGTTELL